MLSLAAQALLSLCSGACLSAFLEPVREKRPWLKRALTFSLSTALCAHALGWCWAARAASALELAPALGRAELAARFLAGAGLGLAAFLSASPPLAPLGLVVGLLFALLGSQAADCLRIFSAWRLLGRFSGTLFCVATPPALAASVAAAALFLRHPDFRGRRWQASAALLLLWAVPARLGLSRLRQAWGLDAVSLSAQAGLPSESAAERVSLAWLAPSSGRGYRFEEKRAVASGVEASPESLEKIDGYLRRRRLNSVFARQGLTALRQGWLFWWEADRALDAAMQGRPGLAAPDYKTALGLLRAGPASERRYRKLQDLAQLARLRKEGFEDVNTSQLIFEGFASAYARFGDEEPARSWLYRVDSLWPIYDKKIEVSPLETMHEGRIEGAVLLDGRPATGLKVGLFMVASSSAAAAGPTGLLSQSDFPDESGRFRFEELSPGLYFLGLMGLPAQLSGRILNSPGVIDISPEVPAVALDPIRVER